MPSPPLQPDGADAAHAERLFALSQDLLGAADANGRLRWVNAAWERGLGWTAAELFARPYLDFIHPADRERVAEFADALGHMPPGESLQLEARALRSGGDYRWLRVSAAVAGGGEPLVYLSGTDVTDLHDALDELARRTRELERSNAELDRFAAVVSHDLRSALTSVGGFLSLLERRHGGELGDEALGLTHSALEGARRMRALVDDLLAYARVGHSGRAPEMVDVTELAERVAQIVAPDARVHVGALPMVRALPGELEQLLSNLLENAAKFVAPQTRAEIRVSAEREDGGWCFEVADNGIGIPVPHAERIFGMLERLHGGDAYRGTGIGLAIAQKVVEGAGGRIWVRPREGGGSVFAFTWPDPG
jgi:PAS domain S-box-containing protein